MDYTRQLDLALPDDLARWKVILVGIGGIGSWTALSLSKIGFKVEMADPDKVESHNVPNQVYGHADVGHYKCEALTAYMCNLGLEPWHFVSLIGQEYLQVRVPTMYTIVVSAVDSMEARKSLWNVIRMKFPFYIDARMGAELCRVFTVNCFDLDEIKWYEHTLVSDDEALNEPCTARAIGYNTMMAASLVSRQVVKLALEDLALPREVTFDLRHLTLFVDGGSNDNEDGDSESSETGREGLVS